MYCIAELVYQKEDLHYAILVNGITKVLFLVSIFLGDNYCCSTGILVLITVPLFCAHLLRFPLQSNDAQAVVHELLDMFWFCGLLQLRKWNKIMHQQMQNGPALSACVGILNENRFQVNRSFWKHWTDTICSHGTAVAVNKDDCVVFPKETRQFQNTSTKLILRIADFTVWARSCWKGGFVVSTEEYLSLSVLSHREF